MPEKVRRAIERLREDLNTIESMGSSYWNKSLGTSHLKSSARQIKNDADSLAGFLVDY